MRFQGSAAPMRAMASPLTRPPAPARNSSPRTAFPAWTATISPLPTRNEKAASSSMSSSRRKTNIALRDGTQSLLGRTDQMDGQATHGRRGVASAVDDRHTSGKTSGGENGDQRGRGERGDEDDTPARRQTMRFIGQDPLRSETAGEG